MQSSTSQQSRAVPKPGMFQALAIRDFRLLWTSNIAASFAMQMQMVARGWLIYDMTESPLALTWVMLSFMLPSLLFSLLGGVIADRMQKKAIMITSQILNTVATAVLATIVYNGDVTFWHFIYFGLFNGTVLSFSMPARSAVIPEIVGREVVVNAMALQSATFNLSRILGPTLAGVLIAVFAAGDTTSTTGVGIVFFVIAALYLVSVTMTALLNYQGHPERSREATMLADVAEGFQYMRQERVILGLLIMGFLPMTFGFTASFLLPVFNSEVIGGGPEDLGYMLTAMGGRRVVRIFGTRPARRPAPQGARAVRLLLSVGPVSCGIRSVQQSAGRHVLRRLHGTVRFRHGLAQHERRAIGHSPGDSRPGHGHHDDGARADACRDHTHQLARRGRQH